jgi:putative endonuclease
MPNLKRPCVYIMASGRNGTLYVGVTSDLIKRVHQQQTDAVEGFTKAHHVHTLVWFEQHETIESAILREKASEEWKRAWKIRLIEKANPTGVICTRICFEVSVKGTGSGFRRNDEPREHEEPQ